MSIELKKNVAVFSDYCTVEEADVLFEWLLKNPKGVVNLAACVHIHTAILQVLIFTKVKISSNPRSKKAAWILPLINSLIVK
jgi:hypothetical protein